MRQPPVFLRRWQDSRDYKGRDFRSYINPNFYERIAEDGRFTLREYLDLESNNQLVVLNTPLPTSTGLFSRSELLNGQVSPDIPKGIYQADTTASVFYWVGQKQVSQSFRIVKLNDLSFEQLAPDVETSIFQDLLIWASGMFPDMPRFDDTGRFGRFLNMVLDRLDYGEAIGVWVPSFQVTEDISAVTGSAPSLGLLDSIGGVQTEEDKVRSFLPFLVSGFGLATGSPVLIGSGFVLRYLESVRK